MIINNSEPTITNNLFYRNSIAIKIEGNQNSPQISNNIFEEDTYAPVQLALGSTPVFSGNIYTNNALSGIAIASRTYSDPTYQLSLTSIAGLTNIPYIIGDDLTISASSTLTIDPGVVIKFTEAFNSKFNVNGTLIAQGTEEQPIVFTEIDDDEFGGDTNNNGDATVPQAGNWEGIVVNESSGSSTLIDNCLIRYGG